MHSLNIRFTILCLSYSFDIHILQLDPGHCLHGHQLHGEHWGLHAAGFRPRCHAGVVSIGRSGVTKGAEHPGEPGLSGAGGHRMTRCDGLIALANVTHRLGMVIEVIVTKDTRSRLCKRIEIVNGWHVLFAAVDSHDLQSRIVSLGVHG